MTHVSGRRVYLSGPMTDPTFNDLLTDDLDEVTS